MRIKNVGWVGALQVQLILALSLVGFQNCGQSFHSDFFEKSEDTKVAQTETPDENHDLEASVFDRVQKGDSSIIEIEPDSEQLSILENISEQEFAILIEKPSDHQCEDLSKSPGKSIHDDQGKCWTHPSLNEPSENPPASAPPNSLSLVILTLPNDINELRTLIAKTARSLLLVPLGRLPEPIEMPEDTSPPITTKIQLKPAKRTVNVKSSEQLKSALSSAQPGDHIVLASGNYTGSYSIHKSGSAELPIVIRSAGKLGAVFSGKFAVSGSDVWVWNLKFYGAQSGLSIIGSRHKVVGCWFEAWGTMPTTTTNNSADAVTDIAVAMPHRTDNLEIAYSTFTKPAGFSGWKPGYIQWMRFGIRGRHIADQASYNTHIHHNHFYDFPAKADPKNYRSGQCDAIEVAPIGGDFNIYTLIEFNLFENIRDPGTGSIIDIKGGAGGTARFNAAVNSPGRIDLRSANNWTVEGNYLENTGGISVYGHKHTLTDNRMTGNGSILLLKGVVETNANHHEGNRVRDPVLKCNSGPLKVGTDFSSTSDQFPVVNAIIEGHAGAVALGLQTNTVQRGAICPATRAKKLRSDEVGANAF